MPDTIDRKEFKRLWGSLKKAGWRARPPSGLLSDHAYLKPGVKGKLDNYKADTDYFIGTLCLAVITTPSNPVWCRCQAFVGVCSA
eukprot:jgi/Phyca11/130205/e_gw1.91.147.1